MTDSNGDAKDPHGERGIGEILRFWRVDMLVELEQIAEEMIREPTSGPLDVDNLVFAPGHVLCGVDP